MKNSSSNTLRQSRSLLFGCSPLGDGRGINQYQEQAREKAAKAITDAYTNKLQSEEQLDRLRKENAQLRGHLKALDKQLHPKRYISLSRGTAKDSKNSMGI